MADEGDDKDKAKGDLGDAAKTFLDLTERLSYGVIGFTVTALVLYWTAGMGLKESAEPSVLNAGIAYYSHEASGRVIRALVVLTRVPRQKVRIRRGGTVVEPVDPKKPKSHKVTDEYEDEREDC